VRLLAATKSVDAARVVDAIQAGIRLLGENRVQEAERKRSSIPAGVEFHMIGHLQSNKTRKAVALFDCIQSIDSVKLARAVGEEASRAGRIMDVMLEVNLEREESKSGFPEEGLRAGFGEIEAITGLRVIGLLSIPPVTEPEEARPHFRRLRQLGAELFHQRPHELSMGMSHDFETAIEEGATIVRIGTGIFGERN